MIVVAGGTGAVLAEIEILRENRPKAERLNDAVDHELRSFQRCFLAHLTLDSHAC